MIDLGTDMLPALALAAERPEAGLMERPPRRRTERLLSWPLLARAYLFLGPMQAVAAMAAFFFVLVGRGWSYGEILAPTDPVYLQATTACLVAIVVMQIANVFLCRSPRLSILTLGPFGNRLILAGILVEIAIILLDRLHGSGQCAVWDRTCHSRGVAVCDSVRTRHAGHGRGPEVARAPRRVHPPSRVIAGVTGGDAMRDGLRHGRKPSHQGAASDQDRDRKAQATPLPGATGRHCVRSVATALPGATVRETIDGLLGHRFDCLEHVHVLDAGGRLIGLVPLIRLLAAQENSRLEDIMDADPPTAGRTLSQDRLVMLARRHRIAAPPVVNREGRLLGCVPPDAVIEIAGRMHAQDISGIR